MGNSIPVEGKEGKGPAVDDAIIDDISEKMRYNVGYCLSEFQCSCCDNGLAYQHYI